MDKSPVSRVELEFRLCPAYRATLLLISRGGTKSRLISLFLLESFLTKLISNLPKKTGN